MIFLVTLSCSLARHLGNLETAHNMHGIWAFFFLYNGTEVVSLSLITFYGFVLFLIF